MLGLGEWLRKQQANHRTDARDPGMRFVETSLLFALDRSLNSPFSMHFLLYYWSDLVVLDAIGLWLNGIQMTG